MKGPIVKKKQRLVGKCLKEKKGTASLFVKKVYIKIILLKPSLVKSNLSSVDLTLEG
jgi:hypothetical protein